MRPEEKNGKHCKVLVVDDEKGYCEMLKSYLDVRGYRTIMASDGDVAKSLLTRDTYGLVFIDCNMPGLSGVELAKIVRQTNPKARMIMISGYPAINEKFARKLGIDDFLEKPFSLTQIDRLLEINHGKENLSRR